MGIFCFGLGSCGNAQKDKGKEEFQVKAKREVITMADIKNIPMDFWKSGLIIKGCKYSQKFFDNTCCLATTRTCREYSITTCINICLPLRCYIVIHTHGIR